MTLTTPRNSGPFLKRTLQRQRRPVLHRVSMGEDVKGMHAFPAIKCPDSSASFHLQVRAMKPTSKEMRKSQNEKKKPGLRDGPVLLRQIP